MKSTINEEIPPSYRITVQFANGYYRIYDMEYSQAFSQVLEKMLAEAEKWYPLKGFTRDEWKNGVR